MTVLQLILLATHALVAVIFYTDGKRNGYVEGRKAVRKHYEGLMARDQRVNEARNQQLIKAWDNE